MPVSAQNPAASFHGSCSLMPHPTAPFLRDHVPLPTAVSDATYLKQLCELGCTAIKHRPDHDAGILTGELLKALRLEAFKDIESMSV